MTEQETFGEIDGHLIEVKILGADQDELPEDTKRLGSDQLMAIVEGKLAALKHEVENK